MNGDKRTRAEKTRRPPEPVNETITRGELPRFGEFTPAEKRATLDRWRRAGGWRVGDLIRIRDFGGLVCRVVELDAEILARGGRGLGVEDPRPDITDLRWYQANQVEFLEPAPDSPPTPPAKDVAPPPPMALEDEGDAKFDGGLDALLRRFYAGLAELELIARNDRLRWIEIHVEAGTLRIRSERTPRVRRVVEAHVEEAGA